MTICEKCKEEIIDKTQSHVLDYEYLADKLGLKGKIKYIELRDEYKDFIIVMEE